MEVMRVFYRLMMTGMACWLALTACIREGSPAGGEGLRPGDCLPFFSVRMNDGTVLSPSSLEGKVSVLAFFHTGCPDCQKELPVIQRLYDCYSADSSVVIGCISREEGAEEVGTYWRQQGFTMPYSAQAGREVYALFSSRGIPRVYVVRPDLVVYSVYSDNPLATLTELTADLADCLGR